VLRAVADVPAVEVARRAGLHADQLSHIEAGRRPVTVERAAAIIAAIAAAPVEAPA
jgi:hypothetical protein